MLTPGKREWCSFHRNTWAVPKGRGIYVIELSPGANRYLGLTFDPCFPVLYVGQSHYSPEARFYEHMCAPERYSNIVRRNGRRLRYDLFDYLTRIQKKEDAQREEELHSYRLANLGFHTYFDGRLIRPTLGGSDEVERELWGITHVRRSETWVDQAIFSVVAEAYLQLPDPRLLGASVIEEILRGGVVSPEISDVIFRARGKFAYLEEGILEHRVRELLESGHLTDTGCGLILTSAASGSPDEAQADSP